LGAQNIRKKYQRLYKRLSLLR